MWVAFVYFPWTHALSSRRVTYSSVKYKFPHHMHEGVTFEMLEAQTQVQNFPVNRTPDIMTLT